MARLSCALQRRRSRERSTECSGGDLYAGRRGGIQRVSTFGTAQFPALKAGTAAGGAGGGDCAGISTGANSPGTNSPAIRLGTGGRKERPRFISQGVGRAHDRRWTSSGGQTARGPGG